MTWYRQHRLDDKIISLSPFSPSLLPSGPGNSTQSLRGVCLQNIRVKVLSNLFGALGSHKMRWLHRTSISIRQRDFTRYDCLCRPAIQAKSVQNGQVDELFHHKRTLSKRLHFSPTARSPEDLAQENMPSMPHPYNDYPSSDTEMEESIAGLQRGFIRVSFKQIARD